MANKTSPDMRLHGNIIRAAFDKGRRKVLLPIGDGKVQIWFKITKHSRAFVKQLGPHEKPNEQFEVSGTHAWLTAKPMDGRLTPVYSVETKPGSLGVVTKAQR